MSLIFSRPDKYESSAAEVEELTSKLLTSKNQVCIKRPRKAPADLAKQASGLLFLCHRSRIQIIRNLPI